MTAASPLSADVIGHMLSFLPPQDLLRMGTVCKSWRRIADAPHIWLPHLNSLASPEGPFSEDECASLIAGGLLTIKDLYLLSHAKLLPLRDVSKNVACSMLRWCPWHPRKHIDPSLQHMYLLCLCYVFHRPAFNIFAGKMYYGTNWNSFRDRRCTYFGLRFDRLVAITLRTLLGLLILFIVVPALLLYASPWRTSLNASAVTQPLLLSILGAGVTSLFTFECWFNDTTLDATRRLGLGLVLTFALLCLLSAAPYLLSHLFARAAVVVVSALIALAQKEEEKSAYIALASGAVGAFALVMWRVSLPALVVIVTYVTSYGIFKDLRSGTFRPFGYERPPKLRYFG